MNGETAVTTSASYHEKIKHMPAETINPSAASTMIPAASVVSPLIAVISPWITFDKTPGALSLSSNHPMSFIKIASNNLTLSLKVKFSPPKLKLNF